MSKHSLAFIQDSLRQTETFARLSEAAIALLATKVSLLHYERGEILYHQGDRIRYIYFVHEGLVKVSRVDEEGREMVVSLLGPKQVFPHVGFFEPIPYPGSAQVILDGLYGVIRVSDLQEVMQKDPAVSIAIVDILGRKILELQERLVSFGVTSVHDRLLRFLRQFAALQGQADPKGTHIYLPMTHQEIGNLVGATRETINRSFAKLKQEGLVFPLENGHWLIHDSLRGE